MTKQEIDEAVQKYRLILESGEPTFLLRGQDKFAAHCVEFWINEATWKDLRKPKVNSACDIAHAMQMWPKKKLPD